MSIIKTNEIDEKIRKNLEDNFENLSAVTTQLHYMVLNNPANGIGNEDFDKNRVFNFLVNTHTINATKDLSRLIVLKRKIMSNKNIYDNNKGSYVVKKGDSGYDDMVELVNFHRELRFKYFMASSVTFFAECIVLFHFTSEDFDEVLKEVYERYLETMKNMFNVDSDKFITLLNE